MNNRTAKKIRREIRKTQTRWAVATHNGLCGLPFRQRLRIAWMIAVGRKVEA